MRRLKYILMIFAVTMLLLAPGAFAKDLKLAPEFKLMDLYQDMHTLSSYRDKQAVLLFFWTTWCPYCAQEIKVLNQRYAGLVDDGLEVLAINVGELPDLVSNTVKNDFLSFQVLLDKDSSVSQTFGIAGVPTYVLIDKKGYIVFQDNRFPDKEYKDLLAGTQPIAKDASGSKGK